MNNKNLATFVTEEEQKLIGGTKAGNRTRGAALLLGASASIYWATQVGEPTGFFHLMGTIIGTIGLCDIVTGYELSAFNSLADITERYLDKRDRRAQI